MFIFHLSWCKCIYFWLHLSYNIFSKIAHLSWSADVFNSLNKIFSLLMFPRMTSLVLTAIFITIVAWNGKSLEKHSKCLEFKARQIKAETSKFKLPFYLVEKVLSLHCKTRVTDFRGLEPTWRQTNLAHSVNVGRNLVLAQAECSAKCSGRKT